MLASELIKQLEQGISLYGDKPVVLGGRMCDELGNEETMVMPDVRLIACGEGLQNVNEFIILDEADLEYFTGSRRHLESVK